MLQKIKRLGPVKVGLILFALLAALSIAFAIRDEVSRMTRQRDAAFESAQTITVDGETYRYAHAVHTNFLRNGTQTLVGRAADGDYEILSGARFWSETCERFAFAAGRRIQTCRVDGSDRQTIWSASVGINESAQVSGVWGDLALVCTGRKPLLSRLSDRRGCWVWLDLTTGAVTQTDLPAAQSLTLLCREGDALYCRLDAGGASCPLLCISLSDGTSQILVGDIVNPQGEALLVDGWLYFYNCRVSLNSGAAETLFAVNGDCVLQHANGRLYYAYTQYSAADSSSTADGQSSCTLVLSEFDPETSQLRELATWSDIACEGVQSLHISGATATIEAGAIYTTALPE